MIRIDGAQGEGGGQIVRSSLALAMVTGKACEINHIRAGRKKPGLMRQHLTALKTAAEICHADVAGAAIGSTRVVFRPRKVAAGDYAFSVGTAGSATLVLQTVLPALIVGDRPSTLVIEGGTHNPHAPPFDFLARTFLPLLRRMGPLVTANLDRPGFYPAGGGRMRVRIEPATELRRFELLERGEIIARRVRALVAKLPRHIGERECRKLQELTGWDSRSFAVEELSQSRGPGNVVLVELESRHVTEVFSAFGKIGVRAEAVAASAWDEVQRYLTAGVPVGEHLADQLLLPLGVSVHHGGSGGEFRTLALSRHSTTHIDTLKAFLNLTITTDSQDRDNVVVQVAS
jgi:RNA 3'-terminal phosphate cyclase (ATP)